MMQNLEMFFEIHHLGCRGGCEPVLLMCELLWPCSMQRIQHFDITIVTLSIRGSGPSGVSKENTAQHFGRSGGSLCHWTWKARSASRRRRLQCSSCPGKPTVLSCLLIYMCWCMYTYMFKCMRAGECARMCRAEVDAGSHREAHATLFSETRSLSEHSYLTGVGSHFALKILCLPHLSPKVLGPLSSMPRVDVCAGDLTSGLPLRASPFPLSPLPVSLPFMFWALLGFEKTLGNCHDLGLTCRCDWGTRSYSLMLVTHSRSREPRFISSTGSH